MLLLLFVVYVSAQCVTNGDCPSVTPYCQTTTGTCVACLNDFNCRNKTSCNAICDNFECKLPAGETATVCKWNEVCYNTFSKCYPTCNSDADCAAVKIVLHYPNTGVCDKLTGRCYDCLQTADCKPYRNETCGAQCVFNTKTMEYLCADGNVCKSGIGCFPKSPTTYQCNNGATIGLTIITTLLIAFMLIL